MEVLGRAFDTTEGFQTEVVKGARKAAEKIFEAALISTDMENRAYDAAVFGLYNMIDRADSGIIGDLCYNICLAMIDVSNRVPDRIDYFLRIYMNAGDQVHKVYQTPWAEGFEDFLAMIMSETLHGMYEDPHGDWCILTDRPANGKGLILLPGHTDAADRSNLNFKEADVRERFDDVSGILMNQLYESRARITILALYGRYAVLVNKEEQGAADWIDEDILHTFLAREPDHESVRNQADFVGTLLCLRGMAKSLLSRPEMPKEELQQKNKNWQELLRRWLWDRSLNVANDRMVKYQVM
ncbi:MAG: hypothetical protein LQ340_008000, partial [Diploschistes diacapsis]